MFPELWTMPGTGWPLKSYGFMMMVGFLSGVYLAMRRAMRVKCDPDVVLNCSFIALIAGVAGARVFYVVHYWDEYFAHLPNKFISIVNITQGGLEFVGGLLAATVFIVLYLWRTKRSTRLYTEILAVSTMWSLGIARIGCFLNGCCFGGVCADADLNRRCAAAVEFPYGSPAMVRQWEERRVTLPAELIADSLVNLTSISTKSAIWEAMPVPRQDIYMPPERRERPQRQLDEAKREYEEAKADDPDSDETKSLAKKYQAKERATLQHKFKISSVIRAQQFPSRAEPDRRKTTISELRDLAAQRPAVWVHPTQLYATGTAIALSVFLGRVFHRRKRHGLVFGLMLVTYPVGRFILETIRTDNPIDTFGMTISQAIGVGIFVVGCVYLFVLYRFLPERSPRAIPFIPEEEDQ